MQITEYYRTYSGRIGRVVEITDANPKTVILQFPDESTSTYLFSEKYLTPVTGEASMEAEKLFHKDERP